MNSTTPRPAPGPESSLYRALARTIYLAAGVFVFVWFLDAITLVLLFFLIALILTLALNPPVTWLERKKVPRVLAALLVLGMLGALTVGLGALVVPRLADEASGLAESLPAYATQLQSRAADVVDHYPRLAQRLRPDGDLLRQWTPVLQTALARVGRYSLSILGALVFGLLLFSTVVYSLANPRPLLRGYLSAWPAHLRPQAERAFARSAQAVSGYVWANAIVGAVEAVAAGIALSMLGVPGALVWAAFTLFSEMVPQVGSLLMAVPPVLVALAVDPQKALWVAVFYIVLQQVAGTFLAPIVQGSQMKLHPVSLIFSVLAMGSVFGVLGAFVSTPLAGMVKAFYEEFYLARQPRDEQQDERIENMLSQRVQPQEDNPEREKPR